MNEATEQAIQPESTDELPAAAQAPVVQTPAEVVSGSGSRTEFLQQLPEEIRDHPSLSSINDVSNLGLSFVNAQRLIGADKLPLPKNPTEEDLNKIYNRLGRPESPQDYGIKPDGVYLDEGVVNSFTDVAHKLGLNSNQAKGILDYYTSSIQNHDEFIASESKKTVELTESNLKAEWGSSYDDKLDRAVSAAEEFASPDLLQIKLEDGTKIGNHPAFIKAFSNIAEFKSKVTSEDTIQESTVNSRLTSKDAQARLNAIYGDTSHAYWDKKNPVARQKAVEEVKDLMEMVHGTE
tara:strand:+ start:1371 stop:2249 length:879 start_codon:yes stop_codon:yes gene_type:complete